MEQLSAVQPSSIESLMDQPHQSHRLMTLGATGSSLFGASRLITGKIP
jgi:hypothetical protein